MGVRWAHLQRLSLVGTAAAAIPSMAAAIMMARAQDGAIASRTRLAILEIKTLVVVARCFEVFARLLRPGVSPESRTRLVGPSARFSNFAADRRFELVMYLQFERGAARSGGVVTGALPNNPAVLGIRPPCCTAAQGRRCGARPPQQLHRVRTNAHAHTRARHVDQRPSSDQSRSGAVRLKTQRGQAPSTQRWQGLTPDAALGSGTSCLTAATCADAKMSVRPCWAG